MEWQAKHNEGRRGVDFRGMIEDLDMVGPQAGELMYAVRQKIAEEVTKVVMARLEPAIQAIFKEVK